jgi:hypothetical protein
MSNRFGQVKMKYKVDLTILWGGLQHDQRNLQEIQRSARQLPHLIHKG